MKTGILALLVATASAATYPPCGGFSPGPTPCDGTCIDDPRKDGCGLACDMPGICVADDIPRCAGYAGKKCPDGLACFDDPSDDCDPDDGGFDCSGICLEELQEPEEREEPPTCAGFIGKECPEGLTCIDDPSDDCDPENGGADCIGICVAA